MKVSITKIGNSKGIIIPASILKQYDFQKELNIDLKASSIVLSKPTFARDGWEDAFKKEALSHKKEDILLKDMPENSFDKEEWEW